MIIHFKKSELHVPTWLSASLIRCQNMNSPEKKLHLIIISTIITAIIIIIIIITIIIIMH